MLPSKGAFWLVLIHFLISLSMAILAPVYPAYLKTFVGTDAAVGYVVSFTAAILLIGALSTEKLLKYYQRKNLLVGALVFFTLSYYGLMIVQNTIQLLLLLFVREIAIIISFLIIGLYVKDSVINTKTLGKTEGFYFTFLNLAWLIGPLLGGSLSETLNLNTVFLISSFFSLIGLILVITHVSSKQIPYKDGHHFFSNLKDFFLNKNLTLLYLTSIGLAIWWATIYTYLPLYFTELGVSETIIGYTLFLIVIPLILLEMSVGKWSDKFGTKKFFIAGFLIVGLVSGLIYLTQNITVIIILLVLSCVGVALVEPLRETYFFKTVPKKNQTRLYGVFATGFNFGYLIGPAILSSILAISNFKILFLTTSLFMILFGITSMFIKDTQ